MATTFIGKVFDNYRILENLGKGGMGFVFKALNVRLDKVVAIKMIAPGLALNKNFLNRFKTEAKALAKLENPHIVSIHDLREDQQQWFIVMEYFPGEPLGEIVRRRAGLPWQEALPIVRQILDALQHAHSAGIIHRDIKPNNILINEHNLVKITDFGLAKIQQNVTHTQTSTVGGTLYYMSPEHVRGLAYTDHRSDIYAVGMTFFEMLTGKVPFDPSKTDFDIREAIMRKDLPQPIEFNSKLPGELNDIILKAVAKKPEDRFQSAGEMRQALDAFEQRSELEQVSEPDADEADDDYPEATVLDLEPQTSFEEDQPAVEEATADLQIVDTQTDPDIEPDVPEKKRGWWLPVLIGILVLAAGLFGIKQFYLPAQPPAEEIELNILSTPAGAYIRSDNLDLGTSPQKVTLNRGDNIRLHLEKENYQPLDTVISYQAGMPGEVQLVMREKVTRTVREREDLVAVEKKNPGPPTSKHMERASVQISSQPSGAAVKLGKRFVGTTPLVLKDMPAGPAELTLEKKGYESYRTRLTVKAGSSKDVRAILKAAGGSLQLTNLPDGAEIYVDDKNWGKGRGKVFVADKVSAGAHKISVRRTGFEPFDSEVRIIAGRRTTLPVTMNVLRGDIEVLVKPWGSISIDGQLVKENTDLKYHATLPVGRHHLQVTHPLHGLFEKDIDIRTAQAAQVEVDFTRTIPVSVIAFDENNKPLWAEIVVDGRPTGFITPRQVPLRCGRRTLSVRLKGYSQVGPARELMVDNSVASPQKFIMKAGG